MASEIRESAKQAIAANIAIEMQALRTEINKFIVSATHTAGNASLGLHHAFGHLKSDLVPALEARLIAYCLEVGVSDVDFITDQIRSAFLTGLSAMGQSIAAGHHGRNPSVTLRTAMDFKGWVTANSGGIRSRVLVAVERHKGASGAGSSIVVHSVSGTHVQIGQENNLTTVNISLQQLGAGDRHFQGPGGQEPPQESPEQCDRRRNARRWCDGAAREVVRRVNLKMTDGAHRAALPRKLAPEVNQSQPVRAGLFLAGWELLQSNIIKGVGGGCGRDRRPDAPAGVRQVRRIAARDRPKG